MRYLCYIALWAVVVLLAGCGGHRGELTLDEAKDDGIPFLQEMGIDVRPLITDEQINLWAMSHDSVPRPRVLLPDSSAMRLLKALPEAGVGQDTARVYIVGVRPLQQGNVLVAYVLQAGSEQRVVIVTYSSEGAMVDAIDVGVANGATREGMWNYAAGGEIFSDSISCRVSDGNELLLTRVSSCQLVADTAGAEPARWRMERSYVYSILQNGTFELVQAKTVKLRGTLGEGDPSMATFDMMDLLRYPHSAHGLMPRLDFLATRASNQGSRDFTAVVYQLYSRNPRPFLTWMGENPGNHVEAVFRQLVDTGVVPRDQLLQEIKQVPGQAARNQLLELVGGSAGQHSTMA